MKNDNSIKRIRKLIALSMSPYPREAETALRMAEKLADKYGVNISDFLETENIHCKILLETESKLLKWQIIIAELTSAFFSVDILYKEKVRGGVQVFLSESEGHYLRISEFFNFLRDKIEKRGDEFIGVVRDTDSFRRGMADGISSRLQELYSDKFQNDNESCEGKSAEKQASEDGDDTGNSDPLDDREYGWEPNSYGIGFKLGTRVIIRESLTSFVPELQSGGN